MAAICLFTDRRSVLTRHSRGAIRHVMKNDAVERVVRVLLVAARLALTFAAIDVPRGSRFGDCCVKCRLGVAFRSQQERNSQSNC
ncbi:hypothetical protein [Bradyrhizobium sp. SZCCHNRI3018]|uniref:hypothetical protein n=1 Tax=Bradyrhizobium sp. SZCCHNRI3018 TaxID=3057289 RepID=UPI0029169FB9|nr:hypothetical protein [Bradyrhizobium sp. SZCCHNRI3018]